MINHLGWAGVILHDYLNQHIEYLQDCKCEYEIDYYIVTYRELSRRKNSHLWFFKDHGMALAFAIRWSGRQPN